MRILLISAEFPPDVGGVGDYTRRLALALGSRGHQMAVLTGRYGVVRVRETDEGAQLETPMVEARAEASTSLPGRPGASTSLPGRPGASTSLPGRPGQASAPTLFERWSLRPVEAAITAFEPDIVHLQYQTGAYGMHPAVMLLPARLRQKVPVLVTAHDLRLPYLFPKADALRTWLTGRLLGDAAAVILTNAEDARRLDGLASPERELYSPRRPLRARRWVIPIGSNIQPAPPAAYDRGACRAAIGADADAVLLVYFGLLSRTKGVTALLEALTGLPPRYRLLLVGGSAPLPDDRRFADEVAAMLEQRGLRERVTITGPLPEQEVSAHLLASDIAVLPFADGASYRRGSLLAVLGHGLPTITTLPPAPLDPPLLQGYHAMLLPPADATALRSAIERLADDAALRQTLSGGALALAAEFGWPAIAERHESVYHAV